MCPLNILASQDKSWPVGIFPGRSGFAQILQIQEIPGEKQVGDWSNFHGLIGFAFEEIVNVFVSLNQTGSRFYHWSGLHFGRLPTLLA